jgi:hypothetical protein
MRLHKHEHPITCLADWQQHAGPKTADQWREGRSAFELAYAWCGTGAPAMPEQVLKLLESRSETRGMVVRDALPEHQIRFDSHGGEPRNADLAFTGMTSTSKIAVTVEAKADEPFGDTVSRTIEKALERSIGNPRSRGVRRVEDLVRALVPAYEDGLPRVESLRYQLLTATAGTLAYAALEEATFGVLLVHEFRTRKTNDTYHARNADDYRLFLRRLSAARATPSTPSADSDGHDGDGVNALTGPFTFPASPAFAGIGLFVGKISTDRRQS